MNFIALESAQKLRGGFYTNPELADFLVRWVATQRPRRILEPSCGDGAFFEALGNVGASTPCTVVGCELDADEAAKARTRASANLTLRVDVHAGDFLRWFLYHGQSVEPFDAAIGNPPFIRYQYLPEQQQFLAERVFHRFGLPFSKHANAWVPFVIASLALLRPGGRLSMVVPSEILHIPHAQSLRRFLAEQCSRILLIDPTEIWFADTLQGTVLLLAEKKPHPAAKGLGVAVVQADTRHLLRSDPEDIFRRAAYANGATIEGKWMSVLLTPPERALLGEVRQHSKVKSFADIASVDVGIVTGANKFFLVPDSVVEEFDLGEWAHPMFGRSDHVQGLVYTVKDHRANKAAGLPANFLWFQEANEQSLPSNVRKYLDEGLRQNLQTRFKCRVRTPWYRVPSVSAAPVAMLKRAHHFPRLVLNTIGAYTTDTAYRIRPTKVSCEALVFAFPNSLTCLTAELEGRHYGGGVLELVPSEIERLLVPLVRATPAELSSADARFRLSQDEDAFLRSQDAIVLTRIGLSQTDQDALQAAWARLRDRRHRISPAVEDESPEVQSISIRYSGRRPSRR